jgi:hypothetical protein
VQAQDYLGSLWAIGLRLRDATAGAVEQASANRTIVRTWPMRGTLHWVPAEDARWMLDLMAPRVIASHARRLERHYGLDAAALGRSRDALAGALEGGNRLSRSAMYQALETAGITTAGQRGLHVLWRLAQEGLICLGPRASKQPTFVLLDEWVPRPRRLDRAEALAEITIRYFAAHGPATVQDFMWWSGLPAADARAGLATVQHTLVREVASDRTYWRSPASPAGRAGPSTAYLLPAFDEYTVAYRDRSAVLSRLQARRTALGNAIFNPTIVLDGQVVATWSRTLKPASVVVTTKPFTPLTRAEKDAIAKAARRYGAFLELAVEVE